MEKYIKKYIFDFIKEIKKILKLKEGNNFDSKFEEILILYSVFNKDSLNLKLNECISYNDKIEKIKELYQRLNIILKY